jgi:hypothetical protein
MTEDPHHCHCFSIHQDYHNLFKQKLIELGFKEPLFQENHGQIFGLTLRIDEFTQAHIKLLKNGTIEGEMEYPPDYPVAHLNPTHSYSAHIEIQNILNQINMPSYSFRITPPITCIQRKIIKAFKPTHVKVIVGVMVGFALIGAIAYTAVKSSKN